MVNFIRNLVAGKPNSDNQNEVNPPKADSSSVFDNNLNASQDTVNSNSDTHLYQQLIDQQTDMLENQPTVPPIIIEQDNIETSSSNLEQKESVVVVICTNPTMPAGPSEKPSVVPVENVEVAKDEETKYSFDFEVNLTEEQELDLEKFKQNYENNKDKYEEVERATGVPAELVASIHWRESGGNFNTYLHNGDKLGKKMVHEPKIDAIYYNWTDGAIDAIKSQDTSIINQDDINTLYEYAERYNGLGYRKKGVSSPYVWSGTSNYTSGKYVADGHYSATTIDDQLGIAVMMKAICT